MRIFNKKLVNRKLGAIILLLTIIIGCAGKDTSRIDVLQQEKYTQVLLDIALAESYAMAHNYQSDSVKTTLKENYLRIFKIHDITKNQFYKAFDYYNRHPDILKMIYEDIYERLNILHDEKFQDIAE